MKFRIHLAHDKLQSQDFEIRLWLEDTLGRIPTEEDITVLLPENWRPLI